MGFLDRFKRRHTDLTDYLPNVPDDWATSDLWRTWPAPLNIVVGEHYRQDAIRKLAGPPRQNGYLVPVQVDFVREPSNIHDANAIRAEVRDLHVGYMAADLAEQLAPILDQIDLKAFSVAGLVRGGIADRAESLGVHVWIDKRLSLGFIEGVEGKDVQEVIVAWPPDDYEGKPDDWQPT